MLEDERQEKMSTELISILMVGVALAGFLWNLHRDIADLRERMARLEGLLEDFTRAKGYSES